MGTRLELLESEAMQLSASERASLAQALIASLDEDSEIEEAWIAEAQRRDAAMNNGQASGVSMAYVFTKIRSSLK
jgi:putative addiction module component (TIGR02574 family)